ncbi:MAG: hypothetical protein IIV67_02390, partial [Bacteroidaceae bacterium]|nr:hypothetical protein [Bacteroidaceae bacterium]
MAKININSGTNTHLLPKLSQIEARLGPSVLLAGLIRIRESLWASLLGAVHSDYDLHSEYYCFFRRITLLSNRPLSAISIPCC